jgi:hypothetical protein
MTQFKFVKRYHNVILISFRSFHMIYQEKTLSLLIIMVGKLDLNLIFMNLKRFERDENGS